MLRALVLILIAVNAAFWAWTQGWLNVLVGNALRPDVQHEPERLGKQTQAAQVKMLMPAWAAASVPGPALGASGVVATAASAPPAVASSSSIPSAPAAASASAPAVVPGAASATAKSATVAASSAPSGGLPAAVAASAPPAAAVANTRTRCVEAGPFQAAEFAAAEAQIKKALPGGNWQVQSVSVPGLWLVYMGPYADPDMYDKKQAELRRIRGLNFEEVRTPAALAQGLSLGRYNQLPEAEAALNQLRNRGIRTARVVNVRPAMQVQLLRVPAADDAAIKQLNAVKLPQDKGFIACRV